MGVAARAGVGSGVGVLVGVTVGGGVDSGVGMMVGAAVGADVGAGAGVLVGAAVGGAVGAGVGPDPSEHPPSSMVKSIATSTPIAMDFDIFAAPYAR